MKKPYKPPLILDIVEDILTIKAAATVFRPTFVPTKPARPSFRPRCRQRFMIRPRVALRSRPAFRPFRPKPYE